MPFEEQAALPFDEPANQKSNDGPFVLSRPLIFFDLETTGLDIKNDRIVQFAFVRINPDGTRDEWEELINPGCPIPKESTEIHGITDAMVRECMTMESFAPQISAFIENCDLGGFNVLRFDLPFLQNELTRHGYPLNLDEIRVVDAQVIYHKMEPRNLAAAYKHYCEKEIEGAHDAMNDVRATEAVFMAQLEAYADLPKSVDAIHEFCNEVPDRFVTPDRKFYWRNGKAVISFGKYRSKSIQWMAQHDPEYLKWMTTGEFAEETKAMVKDALEGKFPEKK